MAFSTTSLAGHLVQGHIPSHTEHTRPDVKTQLAMVSGNQEIAKVKTLGPPLTGDLFYKELPSQDGFGEYCDWSKGRGRYTDVI